MGRTRSRPRNARPNEASEIAPDRNKQRRAKYASDADTRDAAKSSSRESYREKHPLPSSPLARGLLTRGVNREVTHDDLEHPVVVESFTIPEAAAALGKSEPNFRRWLDADKIPGPYLRDRGRGYLVYSVGELETIARVLHHHQQEFAYLTQQHEHIIHTMFQYVQAYRSQYI